MNVLPSALWRTLCLHCCAFASILCFADDPPVDVICAGSNLPYQVRVAAVERLGAVIPTNDASRLWEFISAPASNLTGMTAAQAASLKNDILNAFWSRDIVTTGMGEQLTTMVVSETNDVIWQGYSLQHLGPLYRVGTHALASTSSPPSLLVEIANVQTALWQAAASTNDGLSCIALTVLDSLCSLSAGINDSNVMALSAAIALDSSRSPGITARALTISARRGDTNVLPAAVLWAQCISETVTCHAAIQTLGAVGGEDEIPTLESLAQSTDVPVSNLATKAIAQIEARL